MEPGTYNFSAKIWLWSTDKSPAAWHFVTVPAKMSDEIEALYKGVSNKFGSTQVNATIGNTTWQTALFHSKELGFIMPLKAPVRKKENLEEDDTVKIHIEIIM